MNKIDKKLKFKDNPRRISARQRELLEAHLQELGDLSGVVYCRLNKAYVGGNQRSDIFHGSKITVYKEFSKPTAQGTVLHGFIEYVNEKGNTAESYAYREVEFTPEQFRKACIVANNDGGEWDMETLSTWDADELEEWGFELEAEFDSYGNKNKEIDTSGFSADYELTFTLTEKDYHFIVGKLQDIGDTKEQALLKLCEDV